MKNIAIFASGNGSNAQNIIAHFNGGNIASVKLVICNNPNAYVLQRASALGVPATVMDKAALTADNPSELLSLLHTNAIDYIVLAGYLQKIPAALTTAFAGRIINIHPALLPKFGGKGMYGIHVHRAVVAAGEKLSGITIHLVDAVYDNGKILFQAQCTLSPHDTPEDVAAKVQGLEQQHYPAVIEQYIKGYVSR
jgi:phosphoribosylglycinamide formyltransferase-1